MGDTARVYRCVVEKSLRNLARKPFTSEFLDLSGLRGESSVQRKGLKARGPFCSGAFILFVNSLIIRGFIAAE